jgi:hypothetical protein
MLRRAVAMLELLRREETAGLTFQILRTKESSSFGQMKRSNS